MHTSASASGRLKFGFGGGCCVARRSFARKIKGQARMCAVRPGEALPLPRAPLSSPLRVLSTPRPFELPFDRRGGGAIDARSSGARAFLQAARGRGGVERACPCTCRQKAGQCASGHANGPERQGRPGPRRAGGMLNVVLHMVTGRTDARDADRSTRCAAPPVVARACEGNRGQLAGRRARGGVLEL